MNKIFNLIKTLLVIILLMTVEVAKSQPVSETIKRKFPKRGCASDSVIWFAPDESGIYFYEERPSDTYSEKKVLEYEMYDNPEFKGKAAVKLNEKGLFIGDVKKCNWHLDEEHIEKGRESFNAGRLVKYVEKETPGRKPDCDVEGAKHFGFIVSIKTDKYYEVVLDKKKYYIDISKNPKIVYEKSMNQRSEELQNKFYDQFNANFSENQNKFISFVEKAKSCYERKSKDKSCGLPKIDERFMKYLCYSKLVKCADRVSKWKVTKEMENIYWTNLNKCFDYKEMKMNLLDLLDERGNNFEFVVKGTITDFTIYTKLTGFKHNIFCDYKVKFDGDKIKNIEMATFTDIGFPGPLDEEEEYRDKDELDTPDYELFASIKEGFSNRSNSCLISERPKDNISISEIGDKNAKKLGK